VCCATRTRACVYGVARPRGKRQEGGEKENLSWRIRCVKAHPMAHIGSGFCCRDDEYCSHSYQTAHALINRRDLGFLNNQASPYGGASHLYLHLPPGSVSYYVPPGFFCLCASRWVHHYTVHITSLVAAQTESAMLLTNSIVQHTHTHTHTRAHTYIHTYIHYIYTGCASAQREPDL